MGRQSGDTMRNWLHVTKRLMVSLCAVAVVYSLSTSASSASDGRWSPATGVGGPAIQDLVFGPGNVPWALFDNEYGSRAKPQIARLTSRYSLVEQHRIPGVPGYKSSDRLYVNRRGVGAVLSNLTEACNGCMGPLMGIGVLAWRPGKAPSRPLVLTGNRVAGPSIAISSTGTIAVAFATWQAVWEKGYVLAIDRVSKGRIIGAQEIPISREDVPVDTEVVPVNGGGFRAEWQLGGFYGLTGLETAEVSASGLLSAGAFVPWPYEMNPSPISRAIVRSDPRGDEVALWPAKEPEFGKGTVPTVEWELASRMPGGSWSMPQLIGNIEGENINEIAVAITPAGRFTVVWTSAEKKQMVLGGVAGDPASSAVPLQRHPEDFTETFQHLVLTTTDRVVAIWQAESGFPISKSFIEAATSVDGIHFSAPKRISPTHWCRDALLVPDHVGGALASWRCGGRRANGYARYRP
jgi:hypothetical protein